MPSTPDARKNGPSSVVFGRLGVVGTGLPS